MLKKHFILIGIIIALSLLGIATRYYPGGSQRDKNSIGYEWTNNYISNLFGEKAVNGEPNGARPWAAAGMFFYSVSFALFFIDFSKKIPKKGAAKIVRYCGTSAMVVTFLAVTPLHDIAIIVGSTLALVSMFYITVFVLKSRLHFFKALSVVCLIAFYAAEYVYGSRNHLEVLPILQKTVLVLTVAWVLCLQYFTTANDFKDRNHVATKAEGA